MASKRNAAALLALGGAALVASCASTPEQITHSPKAQKELDAALAGRTPGPAVDCILNYPAEDMQVIDDWTLLFKDNRDSHIVYVQNPRGGCPGVGNPNNTLITHHVGTTQICSGDIAKLVDLPGRIALGACVFGPFVPYTKPS